MIYGIGIDLVELGRVEALYARQKNFAKRILTPNEQLRFYELSNHRQMEFLAGRFAAKEAFSKAMGTGIGKKISFQDIEILPNAQKKPVVTTDKFQGNVHLSISHSETYAIAQIILEKS